MTSSQKPPQRRENPKAEAARRTGCRPDSSRAQSRPPEDRPAPEKFRNSADAVAVDAINRELDRMGVVPERLTSEERLKVITALEASGTFLLKGAVKSAAASLHCSQASIYRYLAQVKNPDHGQT